MFILSKDESAIDALKAYRNEIKGIHTFCSEIYDIKLGDYFLYWFSAKPEDGLTVYNDGIIIGKSTFQEKQKYKIIKINSDLPVDLNPLLRNSVFRITCDGIKVIPNETSVIFYNEAKDLSDSQLIIAKHRKYLPDHYGVSILAGIGYFPGNLTLFSEIKKIPYLYGLDLDSLSLFEFKKFIPKKANDNKVIERLINILPANLKSKLAISGGLDSRFILGLLLKKQIVFSLISMKGSESIIVERISKHWNLPLEVNKFDKTNPYIYTLLSDARIYFRGGNYSQMHNTYSKDEIIYTGLMAKYENMFATAWKKPGSIKNIYNELINYGLLSTYPNNGFASFVNKISKAHIFTKLQKDLDFGTKYHDFKKKKQWASWFAHLHRSITWIPAHLADLSFFIQPVQPTGDKISFEYAIKASAYSNFNKERLRRINQNLFDNGQIDYSDGRKFKSDSIFIQPFNKLYNEYLRKLFKRIRKSNHNSQKGNIKWVEDVNTSREAISFQDFFCVDLAKLISDEHFKSNEKRAAVTINHTLLFLEN